MKNLFNSTDTAELLRRLAGLTPNAKPRWGSLMPGALLCHLADPLRVALGEKEAQSFRSPLRLPGLAHAVVWILPWPKSAPTAPEFLPGSGMTDPTQFAQDQRTLLEVLERFCNVPAHKTLAANPVFGRLSRRSWGRLMWRHIDHHMRQYGL